MVRVCDAIMGSGKSSAAITFMNERPRQKFLYITPYRDEAERIQKACPALDFFVPKKEEKYKWSIASQIQSAIQSDRNVASTHSAFAYYTSEMIEVFRKKEYVLIIDESINILQELNLGKSDLEMMMKSGFIRDSEDGYRLGEGAYENGRHRDFFRLLQSQNLIKMSDSNEPPLYWELPISSILAFKDIYILTYLFEGSALSFYLKMNGVTYEKIGVSCPAAGKYYFSNEGSYTPEYVARLSEMINILENEKMNLIGMERTALSDGWLNKTPGKKVKRGKISPDYDVVRKNLSNYFKHICVVPAEQRMWSTFKRHQDKLVGNGLATSFVPLNARATNEYRHKTALAYCANLFFNVSCKNYFLKNGIVVDEDLYALSTLIQWIWRSAIRDGKPVNIYVPSKRMRDLLTAWIETTAKGGAQNAG